MTISRHLSFARKIKKVVWIATAVSVALLLLIWVQVNALRFVGGAFGCGAINDSIANAEPGKTVIPMIPERNSNAAVISKSLVIQGGWTYLGSEPDCANQGANPAILGTEGLRNAGFTFQAPISRSALTNDSDYPILTISDTVSQLHIEHMSFNNQNPFPPTGGALNGRIDNGAIVRLTNVVISNNDTINNGGGLYLELRGGSHLIIENSQFVDNFSNSGGGFELHLYDNSQVTIMNTLFEENSATGGNGGAGRIVIYDGTVTIQNSEFNLNQASGAGGALSIEGMGGSGTVYILNSTFNNNSAPSSSDVAQSGSGVTVQNLGQAQFLPALLKNSPPSGNFAQITNITLNEEYDYVIEFEASGFTPQLPGQHLHFFFDTVSPSQAGVPAPGSNWKIHGSNNPFTGYNDTDKPPFATSMCVLVANQNHSVQPNTGNCYRLPVNQPDLSN